MTIKTLAPRESPLVQAVTAQVAYTLSLEWLPTTATSISVTAYDDDSVNVTATTLSGSATAPTATTIKLPYFKPASEQEYTLKVSFTVTGYATPFVVYLKIIALDVP